MKKTISKSESFKYPALTVLAITWSYSFTAIKEKFWGPQLEDRALVLFLGLIAMIFGFLVVSYMPILYEDLVVKVIARKLHKNLSKEKVLKILGEPDKREIYYEGRAINETWIYRNTRIPIELKFIDERLDSWKPPFEFYCPEVVNDEYRASEISSDLKELRKVHKDGIITAGEFLKEKRRILNEIDIYLGDD